MIRKVRNADADAIVTIYNHYIENTVITFEEQPLSAGDMTSRIEIINQSELPWIVFEKDGTVVGYAYASKWNGRSAYRFSVETSVYLSGASRSLGIGTELYEVLFDLLRQNSIHAAIGSITLPNPQSIALHEKFGMEKVAHFKEVGYKFGKWLDVGYWQARLSA